VYDPTTTYGDPNVQAWAQYYAQGGKDPTGSVYFISVPGVKEPPPQTPASTTQTQDGGLYNPYAASADHGGQQHPNGSQTSLGSGVAQSASPHNSAAQSVTDLNGTGPGEAQSQLARHSSVASTVVPIQSPHTPSNVNTFARQQELADAPGQSFRQASYGHGVAAPYQGSSPPHEGYPNGVDPYGAGYAPAPVPKSPVGGTEPGWPGVVSQFSAMHVQPQAGEGASAPAQ